MSLDAPSKANEIDSIDQKQKRSSSVMLPMSTMSKILLFAYCVGLIAKIIYIGTFVHVTMNTQYTVITLPCLQ